LTLTSEKLIVTFGAGIHAEFHESQTTSTFREITSSRPSEFRPSPIARFSSREGQMLGIGLIIGPGAQSTLEGKTFYPKIYI